jgi:YVTN family beta-propeller protein
LRIPFKISAGTPLGAVMRVRYAAALLAIVLSVFFEAGCGDTFRPIALPIIQPGGQPQILANAVIISNPSAANPAQNIDGATTHIDIAGDTKVAQVTVGLNPVHAGFVNGNSFTVVANSGNDSVTFYPTFSAITSIPPGSVTLTAGAKPVYVFSNVPNTAYVAQSGLNSVAVVSFTGTPSLSKEIPVGKNPIAITGKSDGTRVYVANQLDGTVSVIDSTSNTLVTSLPNPIVVGGSPSFLAINTDNTQVYVVNKGGDSVSVIDTNANTVVKTVNVGRAPNFAFFDAHNNRVWVTNSGGTTVSSINVADQSVTTIDLTPGCATPAPLSVTVLTDGTRAYVADSGCNAVSVISTLSNTVTKTIPVGTTPVSIVSSTDATKVVVANKGSNDASVINTASDVVEVTLGVPAPPVFLTITK